MNIAIFESVTTEQALVKLETEAEKFEGLYVEMDDKKQRKYVKDQAATIKALLKGGDVKRKAINKENTTQVNGLWSGIESRLKKANEPFTLLIDEWDVLRAKILADEKAVTDARELRLQIEEDHETALDLNELWHFQALEAERIKEGQRKELESKAAVAAIDEEREKVRREAEQEEMRNRARAADIDNRRSVHAGILFVLVNNGVDESEARKVIKLASQNKAGSLVINY